jgi:outer membrane protein assembly factor BamB
MNTAGAVWTATSELSTSALSLTNPDGSPGPSIPLGANPGGSPVVLSNGDVAVCVGTELRRYTAAGALAWTAPLDGAGLSPLALAAPGGEATLLVPTRAGSVVALRAADGARRWVASLTVNVELREGTVRTSAGARTSTAWFTSADGLLHALVVDGALDPAAPWPKAWHDERNTGNLATPR